MTSNEQNQEVVQHQLKGKKHSSKTLKRYDSLDLESSKIPDAKKAREFYVFILFLTGCVVPSLKIHAKKFHIEER